MSYEQKQIFRLTKQLALKQQQLKRERTTLTQKIDLLTAEVAQYQEKQLKNKQLNESIILTYRQNESFREHLNQRELDHLLQQHHADLHALRQKHADDKRQYEAQLQLLRDENQKLRIDAEKGKLDHEKNLAEVRRELEEKQNYTQNDLNVIFNHKIALLTQKLRQAEEMAQLYKEQLQSRARQSYPAQSDCSEDEQQLESSAEDRRGAFLRTQPLAAKQHAKPSQEALSSLQLRINKALVQLNPNQAKLEEKIRQIKFKIY